MTGAEILYSLLPPAVYDRAGARLTAELAAEGSALDDVVGRIEALLAEIFPDTCAETLPDWERVAGLPDPCVGELPSADLRRAALVRKLTLQRGQSRAYFIALANYLLGEDDACSIDELYAPLRAGGTVGTACQGQRALAYFRAGVHRAGDRLFQGATSWIYAWRLMAPLQSLWLFRAGAGRAGHRLRLVSNTVLECVVRAEKPAHTILLFGYYLPDDLIDPFEVGLDVVGSPLVRYLL